MVEKHFYVRILMATTASKSRHSITIMRATHTASMSMRETANHIMRGTDRKFSPFPSSNVVKLTKLQVLERRYEKRQVRETGIAPLRTPFPSE